METENVCLGKEPHYPRREGKRFGVLLSVIRAWSTLGTRGEPQSEAVEQWSDNNGRRVIFAQMDTQVGFGHTTNKYWRRVSYELKSGERRGVRRGIECFESRHGDVSGAALAVELNSVNKAGNLFAVGLGEFDKGESGIRLCR